MKILLTLFPEKCVRSFTVTSCSVSEARRLSQIELSDCSVSEARGLSQIELSDCSVGELESQIEQIELQDAVQGLPCEAGMMPPKKDEMPRRPIIELPSVLCTDTPAAGPIRRRP